MDSCVEPNHKKYLFFDLDGTLVDSEVGIAFSVRFAARQVLSSENVPDIRPFVGPSIDEILRRALSIEDPHLISALCHAYRESYDQEGWQLSSLYPGAVDTLEAASERGIQCVLLTNKPIIPTTKMVAHFKLEKYFSSVIAPGMQPGIALPKPQALHVYCQQRCLLGQSGWVIGDSRDDAEAAARCNFGFIACRYGYGDAARQKEFPVTEVIDCLSEVHKIMENKYE